MPLTFEVINKNTPDFLDKIGKEELGMLVQMLEDLDHGALDKTKKAYGYLDNEQWDENQLSAYKAGILSQRMREQDYTFFLLRNEKNDVVALASGNAMEDKTQLRILNVTVARQYQEQGYGAEIIKHLAHHAAENKFENIVLPMSAYALKKGDKGMYENIAAGLELDNGINAHPNDPSSIELRITPKKFKSLEARNAEKNNWFSILTTTIRNAMGI